MPPASTLVADVLPAEDPVARYVTELSMIGNDAARLGAWATALGDIHSTDPASDEAGKGLFLFRLQIGLLVEARKFLAGAQKRSAAVAGFVSTLSPEFSSCLEKVTAGSAPELEKWMKTNRNGTFHYPPLPPDIATSTNGEIGKMLAEAADVPWQAPRTAPLLDARYKFADDLIAQSLPDLPDDDLYGALGDMVVALIRMVHIAVETYIASLDHGSPRPEWQAELETLGRPPTSPRPRS